MGSFKCPICGRGKRGCECTPPVREPMPSTVILPCLCCGAKHTFPLTSPEANGVFNVFCPGGECEDRYAARQ